MTPSRTEQQRMRGQQGGGQDRQRPAQPAQQRPAQGGQERQAQQPQQNAQRPQQGQQGGQREMPSKTALGEKGRKGDDTVAHLDSGEVVIPKDIAQNEQMRQALERAFDAAGLDINQYEVGNEANSINPETGYPEFYSIDEFQEDVSDVADSASDALSDAGDAVGEVTESALDVATVGQYSAAKDVAQGREPEIFGETREDAREVGRRAAEAVTPDMPDMKTPGRQQRDTGATGATAQKQARDSQLQQRRRAALASGRASTILTGPMGATGEANTSSTTLLGA
jgi:hypothetical protein